VSRSRALAASAALGTALAAISFLAQGGTDLSRTTIAETGVVLITGLALTLAALLWRSDLRLWGAVAVGLFAALTLLTAMSMAWSIDPGLTLEEGARTFAYLGVFAAAVALARLAPGATTAVLGGVLVAGVAVTGWALLTRVFPGLEEVVLGARLSAPLGYTNALGSMAAVTAPAALWLGARRGGGLSSALAYPAMGVLLLTVLLTQSRGALAALIVAAALWLVFVPLRLRTVPVIALPAIAVAPVAAWALSKDAFTKPLQPSSAREAVAGDFGLMLALMCVALLAAGLALGAAASRRAPSLPVRRRVGIGLAVLACMVPLVTLTSVAMSDRGLGGTISDRFDQLTDTSDAPPVGGRRLGSVSSSRGVYWRQARRVFESEPVAGTGAGTFGLSSLPFARSNANSRHAHGFVAQTAADLGSVGLAVVLALMAAWLAAAARAVGALRRRRPRPEWTAERAGLCALSLCAIAFGLHSLIDWIWFVPGPTAVALTAAGFVAGRGAPAAVGAPPDPEPQRVSLSLSSLGVPRLMAAGALLVTTLLCAWAVWQPERAERANDRALELVDQGKLGAAEKQADRAREIDPYSADPLYAKSQVLAAQGHKIAGYHALEQAVIEHPRDPVTWAQLGRYELRTLDLPDRALETAQATFRVDPYSEDAVALRDQAQRIIDQGG
jgi:tetratricopeptide (TPR) repeat protein